MAVLSQHAEPAATGRPQRPRIQPAWRFFVPQPAEQALRDAVFRQMRAESLLGCAMSSTAHPTLRQWRRLTHPKRAWLLLCAAAQHWLGAALLTPWRGQVWEFDFTCFRAGMPWAVPMARAALAWIFAHAPVQALWGLCPVPNAHAWRLAAQAGFQRWGVLPKACWWARRQCWTDGVVVVAARDTCAAYAAQTVTQCRVTVGCGAAPLL